MKNWFKKNTPQLRIIVRNQDELRLKDFRADEKMCVESTKILNLPHMRLMLDVMKNEHLALFVLPPNSTIEERAARQAQIEGYTMALGNLEAMGQSQKPAEVLTPTFERDDVANQ